MIFSVGALLNADGLPEHVGSLVELSEPGETANRALRVIPWGEVLAGRLVGGEKMLRRAVTSSVFSVGVRYREPAGSSIPKVLSFEFSFCLLPCTSLARREYDKLPQVKSGAHE